MMILCGVFVLVHLFVYFIALFFFLFASPNIVIEGRMDGWMINGWIYEGWMIDG